MAHLQISELVPAPRLDVFDYLTDPQNLTALLAPMIDLKVLSQDVPLKRGNELHFMMTRFGLSQSVRLRIEDVLRGSRLSYRQTEGVFVSWTHTTKFDDHGENGTLVTDIVDYQIPLGILGHLADDILVKGDMSRLLSARLKKTKEHFEAI
jgi:ligand-binding SRPBCC domain-containing protein